MKKFKSAKEISDFFVSNGWGEDTRFTDFPLEEAEKKGFMSVISGIKKGKKYYRMNKCGDIYDDTGELAMFDMPCLKECDPMPFW